MCLVLQSKLCWPRWSKFTVDFGCVNLDSSGAKTKGKRKMRERKEFQSLNVTLLVQQGMWLLGFM